MVLDDEDEGGVVQVSGCVVFLQDLLIARMPPWSQYSSFGLVQCLFDAAYFHKQSILAFHLLLEKYTLFATSL